MVKWAELVLGAGVGALASEILKIVIEQAKVVLAFKTVSKDLASTMEDLLPILIKIELFQKRDELKTLMDTIDKAGELVCICQGVKGWELHKKYYYTKKVLKIKDAMDSFCQGPLQVHQYCNQLEAKEETKELKISMEENFDLLKEEMNKIHQDVIEIRVHVPAFSMDVLCLVPRLGKAPIGFDWPLIELKRKLLDNSVESLLVSAAPGCGKTKLVTLLCHDEEIKKKFTHIFFNVVSSTPNFRKLVHDLLRHNNYQTLTEFENDSQIVGALGKMLEKLQGIGILLVFDDVWSEADSLLEMFSVNIPNLKILVTSRYEFQGFDSTYNLKPLEHKYAETLLIEYALGTNQAYGAEYKELLQKILKICNGLPIVIKVLGSLLENRTLTQWNSQVRSWSNRGKILDNKKVLECLQPSYDALDPQLQRCFLDLGLFLEDQKIRASLIVDIWVELYGITDITSMSYLHDLANYNLLDIVPLGRREPENGFYNEFIIMQHDILRDLAIRIRQSEFDAVFERKRVTLEIKENIFPDWCSNIKASLLSISTVDRFSSNWVDMDCPNVEALVLNISSSEYTLPKSISTMEKLKVVIIINHGFYPTRLSNLSCLSSSPKLKRIRMEKISIDFLDIILLQCSSLTKLSLVMCSFSEVFYDTEETNVFKYLPSLQEIDIDYCYDLDELPFWVCEVVSLKTLSITNCNKLSILPEELGNLSKLEVLRLCSCICLSELPETTVRLDHLRHLDISGCFQLTKLPSEFGNLPELEKISMRNCYQCKLPDSMKNLKNLEVKCDEGTEFLWRRFKQKMKNLTITIEEEEHHLNMHQKL